jgi:ATP-dependent Zn protease
MTMTQNREFVSRPRESERTTRRPLGWWDRVKFLLLFGGLFGFFIAAEMSDNPLLPFREAFDMTLRSKWWVVALFGLEALRQIHFLFCEHSAAYYSFWRHHVFGRWNKNAGKFNAYTRYRVARALKIVLFILVALLILARIFDTTIFRAPYDFLDWLIDNTPQMLQIVMFLVFWIGFQFGLIIFFATRGGVETFFPDDIETRFEDVWGQDQVLDKVKQNLLLLEDPQVIEQHGGYVPAGLLLWGPPGTGKTLMAEAMAGESGKPFVNIDASMLNTMGMGVLKVKLLFRKLRKYALKYDGVVAFFDEADAIGSRGQIAGQPQPGMASTGAFFDHARTCGGLGYLSDASRSCLLTASMAEAPDPGVDLGPRRNRFFMGMGGGMGGGGGGVLQVLLTEMSGLKKPRGLTNRYARRVLGMKPKPPPKYRIVLVMATNLPEALDPAMLRPGRMGDRIYKVGYPSKAGRIRTYRGYLDKIPNQLTEDEVDRLATITPYATGASIKGLVNEALINAIQDTRESVTWSDIVRAKQLKDLGPPEDVEYIERERHATALHEACHALVAYRVRHHLVIDMATIEKGGNYLGMVSSIPPEDLFTRWRSDYEADVMVSLASLVGERMFFEGDSSSGVSGDLESATQLAIFMEGYWGMGSTIASHGVTHRVGVAGGGRPGAGGGPNDENKERELLRGSLAERIEEKLSDIYASTEELIRTNRTQVLAVTHALETHKTLTGEDIEAVIEGRVGPLVDGRPYATEEFAGVAEEYHRQALRAHAEHGKVRAPLPLIAAVGDGEFAPLPVVVGAPAHAADPDANRWAPPIAAPSAGGPPNGRGGNGHHGDAPTDAGVQVPGIADVPTPPIPPGNGSNGGGAAAVTEPPSATVESSDDSAVTKPAKDKGSSKAKDKDTGKSNGGKKSKGPKDSPGDQWGWGSG